MTTRMRLMLVILLLAGTASTATFADSIFSGEWAADMHLTGVQTAPLTAFSSRLDTMLTVYPMQITSRSDFSSDAWVWQSFGVLAEVAFFSIGCDVLFQPDAWAFAYAAAFVKVDFGFLWTAFHTGFTGTMFDGTLYQGSVFELGTSHGPISMRSLTYLGATLDGVVFTPAPSFVPCQPLECPSPSAAERYYSLYPHRVDTQVFTGQQIVFTGRVADDITITSTTTLSTSGFESQEFHAAIWSVAGIPIVFDLTLNYQIQTKSLRLEPRFGLGTRSCYGLLLVELITQEDGVLITGFSVYGLDLHVETPTFAFRSLSLFDTDRFSIYQGDAYRLDGIWIDNAGHAGSCGTAGTELTEFWEVLGFAVYRGDPCCQHLTFLALSFFGSSTDTAFDWMQSQFRAQYTPMPGFAVRTSLTLSKDGISSWSLGVRIAW